jgi:hypothetical protein
MTSVEVRSYPGAAGAGTMEWSGGLDSNQCHREQAWNATKQLETTDAAEIQD